MIGDAIMEEESHRHDISIFVSSFMAHCTEMYEKFDWFSQPPVDVTLSTVVLNSSSWTVF